MLVFFSSSVWVLKPDHSRILLRPLTSPQSKRLHILLPVVGLLFLLWHHWSICPCKNMNDFWLIFTTPVVTVTQRWRGFPPKRVRCCSSVCFNWRGIFPVRVGKTEKCKLVFYLEIRSLWRVLTQMWSALVSLNLKYKQMFNAWVVKDALNGTTGSRPFNLKQDKRLLKVIRYNVINIIIDIQYVPYDINPQRHFSFFITWITHLKKKNNLEMWEWCEI